MTPTSVLGAPARRRPPVGRVPLPVALGLLPALFAFALLAPIPAVPNSARAEVVASVADRLPGWQIVGTRASWEGAWMVVATCGTSRLGFQWVPGHGLRPGDAWLHPEDKQAHDRLAWTSDDNHFLVWFREERRPRVLSCTDELARNSHHRGPIPLD